MRTHYMALLTDTFCQQYKEFDLVINELKQSSSTSKKKKIISKEECVFILLSLFIYLVPYLFIFSTICKSNLTLFLSEW